MLLSAQGITEEDMAAIKLKSQTEEQVEKASEEAAGKTLDKEQVNEDAFNKLQKEMEGIEGGGNSPETKATTPAMTDAKSSAATSTKEDVMMSSAEEENETKATGRYTIQLGSYPKLSEAKEFADAFTIRGYNPLINQVRINDKNWYRVSLGSFNTMNEAKEYVKKEDSLFQGQEYVIVEIK
jgi:cell division protein FtsN